MISFGKRVINFSDIRKSQKYENNQNLAFTANEGYRISFAYLYILQDTLQGCRPNSVDINVFFVLSNSLAITL